MKRGRNQLRAYMHILSYFYYDLQMDIYYPIRTGFGTIGFPLLR